jgi:hypothetical protein
VRACCRVAHAEVDDDPRAPAVVVLCSGRRPVRRVVEKTTAACSLDAAREANAAEPKATGCAQEATPEAITVAQGTTVTTKVGAATVHTHDAV